MQSVSSRVWTRVVVSISYDDNHYTTGTSVHFRTNTLAKGWTPLSFSFGLSLIKPILVERHYWYYYLTHTFQKNISPKVNLIARLEIELVDYNVVFQHVNKCATALYKNFEDWEQRCNFGFDLNSCHKSFELQKKRCLRKTLSQKKLKYRQTRPARTIPEHSKGGVCLGNPEERV